MVLTKEELNRISLEGNFYGSEVLARLTHSPFTFYEDEENGLEVEQLFPSVQDIEVRSSIEQMRKRAFKPVRHRLVHSPGDVFDPVQGRGTFLYLEPQPEVGQVGFAGFDIRVGDAIACSDKVIPYFRGDLLANLEFAKMNPKHVSFGEEFILEADPFGRKVYYILSHEGVLHSPNLELIVDSKSTTGRVGALSHFCGYDFDGKMITMVRPFSFPLKIHGGITRLSQAVVRYKGSPYLQNGDLESCGEVGFSGEGVSFKRDLSPKGLQMRFDTRKMYVAKKCEDPIDMDEKNLDWTKYFDLVDGLDNFDSLENTLYLLGSLGVIDLAGVCAMLSKHDGVLTGTGSLGNLAGVIQPYFRGEITMEYYNHAKTRISTGDPAGYLLFDKIDGKFTRPRNYGGTYQDQKAPRLPKMFKED